MKVAVGALPVLAAIATILTFIFGVSGGASGALPISTYREKVDQLCSVASSEQSLAESALRNFSREFPKAGTVTEARDLIVNQVQQQISAAADLSNALEVLTPPSADAQQQYRITRLLKKNIARLHNYENELMLLSSPLQLVALVQTVPRAEMNADAISGREMLLALGGSGCSLPRWPVIRVVDWSPQLRLRIRRTVEKTARSLGHSGSLGATGSDGALPNPVPVALAAQPDLRSYAAQRPDTERRELRLASSVPMETDTNAESAEAAEESSAARITENASPSLPNTKSNGDARTRAAGG